jgi:regulator of RNase E activity RraA
MEPERIEPLSSAEIEALRRWPTPAVINAIETFEVRPRHEGFMLGLRCVFPELGPMVGYAATATMRAARPGTGDGRQALLAHWRNVARQPAPRVAVIQDLDDPPAFGALWGEVNANVHRALGCVGVVTNGGVRDLDEVRALGFHFFAAEVIPSHAWVHVVDTSIEVRVGGLVVRDGDLLHADQHGVVLVPRQIAREVPRAAAEVEQRERGIIELCQSAGFTLDALEARLFQH